MYPGSAADHIYDPAKMHKFSSLDTLPKIHLVVSSVGTFNYYLAHFLCDLLSSLVTDDHSCKYTFSFVSQLRIQIFLVNVLFPKM